MAQARWSLGVVAIALDVEGDEPRYADVMVRARPDVRVAASALSYLSLRKMAQAL